MKAQRGHVAGVNRNTAAGRKSNGPQPRHQRRMGACVDCSVSPAMKSMVLPEYVRKGPFDFGKLELETFRKQAKSCANPASSPPSTVPQKAETQGLNVYWAHEDSKLDLVLISQSWGTAKNAVFLANYGYFSPWDNYCKSAHSVTSTRGKMRSLHHERGCKNGSYRSCFASAWECLIRAQRSSGRVDGGPHGG